MTPTPEEVQDRILPQYKLILRQLREYGACCRYEAKLLDLFRYVAAYVDYFNEAPEEFKDFIGTTTVQKKMRTFRSLHGTIKHTEEMLKCLRDIQRKMSLIILAQIGQTEGGVDDEVKCWDGIVKFFEQERDIPTIRKESRDSLKAKLLAGIPEHLRDAYRVDFSFRELQKVIKKLDEQGKNCPEVQIEQELILAMRKKSNG